MLFLCKGKVKKHMGYFELYHQYQQAVSAMKLNITQIYISFSIVNACLKKTSALAVLWEQSFYNSVFRKSLPNRKQQQSQTESKIQRSSIEQPRRELQSKISGETKKQRIKNMAHSFSEFLGKKRNILYILFCSTWHKLVFPHWGLPT